MIIFWDGWHTLRTSCRVLFRRVLVIFERGYWHKFLGYALTSEGKEEIASTEKSRVPESALSKGKKRTLPMKSRAATAQASRARSWHGFASLAAKRECPKARATTPRVL